MDGVYDDLDDHVGLITDRGYLKDDVKPSKQVGFWIRQFEEEFDRAFAAAYMDYGPVKFMMPLTGKFNDQLQLVRFEFYYEYDPNYEKLSLLSLTATLGSIRKTYHFKSDDELPTAEEVYQTLNAPITEKENIGLYIKLYYDFQRERDPGNDYIENDPDYRRPYGDIKDQSPRDRPPTIGKPPRLPR